MDAEIYVGNIYLIKYDCSGVVDLFRIWIQFYQVFIVDLDKISLWQLVSLCGRCSLQHCLHHSRMNIIAAGCYCRSFSGSVHTDEIVCKTAAKGFRTIMVPFKDSIGGVWSVQQKIPLFDLEHPHKLRRISQDGWTFDRDWKLGSPGLFGWELCQHEFAMVRSCSVCSELACLSVFVPGIAVLCIRLNFRPRITPGEVGIRLYGYIIFTWSTTIIQLDMSDVNMIIAMK